MKFVSLLIIVSMISFGASAQTASDTAENSKVVKTQKKAKKQKALLKKKLRSAKNSDVTTLSDEKAYKAKWTFESMLMRRLEIDAAEGERKRQKREE